MKTRCQHKQQLTVAADVGVFDGVGCGVAGFEGVAAAVGVTVEAGVPGGVRVGVVDVAGELVTAAVLDDVGVEAAVWDVEGDPVGVGVRVEAALCVAVFVTAAEWVGVLVLAADIDIEPDGEADDEGDEDDVLDAVAADELEDDGVLVDAAV